jgi:hypothetical protein
MDGGMIVDKDDRVFFVEMVVKNASVLRIEGEVFEPGQDCVRDDPAAL